MEHIIEVEFQLHICQIDIRCNAKGEKLWMTMEKHAYKVIDITKSYNNQPKIRKDQNLSRGR